jgi:hypothetical protein
MAYAPTSAIFSGVAQEPLYYANHSPLGIVFAGMLIAEVVNPTSAPRMRALGIRDFQAIDIPAFK